MKRNLIIALTVTALAAANVFAAEIALSPRAKEAVTKTASGTNTDPNNTEYRGSAVAPRTLDNQTKTAAGLDKVNPSMKCARNMTASPKAVGACAESGGAMPCCAGAKK